MNNFENWCKLNPLAPNWTQKTSLTKIFILKYERISLKKYHMIVWPSLYITLGKYDSVSTDNVIRLTKG